MSSRKKQHYTLPPRCRRRHHSSEARAQILVDEEVAKQDPVGVEALANFADSDTAAVGFDDIQATRPREILSWFGNRGNAAQAATYDNIRAAVKPLSLAPRRFVAVKGAKELDLTFAFLRDEARAKAGASRDTQAEAVAALDAALAGAGFQDPSRREDRDLEKPLLSFDAQLARDAATIQLVADANRGGSVAAFPQKLADIVARHADVIRWDAIARELVVVDQARFEREVLPLYFNMKKNHCNGFRTQLGIYGFSEVKQSATDAPRPAGALVYSNTAVADLTKLVRRKSAAPALMYPPAPTRPSREERATRRTGPAPAAACDLPVRPPRASIQACEVRHVGEPWRRFASQSDAARAFPEFDLSSIDISTLINHPSKAKIAVRGRLEARKVTERAVEAAGEDDFVGIYRKSKTANWEAGIKVNGERMHLGTYDSPEAAARAYDEKARAHGRPVNFPRAGEQQAKKQRKRARTAPQSPPQHILFGSPLPEEGPAADEASPAPKRPRVQVDDAAAAAVAAVAAPPVLAPTAAAGASPKRAHASSPVGVTARVQFTHLRETRDVDLTGRCCGPRDAGGEAGAVRRRRRFAGGLVGQVLRGGRPGGARVGLLAENRRGGTRRHRCTAAERRRRRARGSWVVARAARGHPRGPRGVPVGNFPGGPSGAREWSLWTPACSRRSGWEACAEGWVSRGGVGRGGVKKRK